MPIDASYWLVTVMIADIGRVSAGIILLALILEVIVTVKEWLS